MLRTITVHRAVRAALGLGLICISGSVLAQQATAPNADAELEAVVVTGSRIVRDGFEAISATP
jgi:hypothetical protein